MNGESITQHLHSETHLISLKLIILFFSLPFFFFITFGYKHGGCHYYVYCLIASAAFKNPGLRAQL